MKTFVIDASALLASFPPEEPYQLQADALLERYQEGQIQLYAPTLLPHEILNSLYLAVRGKGGRKPRLTPPKRSRRGGSSNNCTSPCTIQVL